jgi:hypothetical protein
VLQPPPAPETVEKSDSPVVPRKPSNNGRQLPAEMVEGRGEAEGNAEQTPACRTLSRTVNPVDGSGTRTRGSASDSAAAFHGTPASHHAAATRGQLLQLAAKRCGRCGRDDVAAISGNP